MVPLSSTSPWLPPPPTTSPIPSSAPRACSLPPRLPLQIRDGGASRASRHIRRRPPAAACSAAPAPALRTCKNCKKQFDPALNHPAACRFHTAHFGGETKRKFESVHTGGTMDTPDSGRVIQYWHCCGSEDPFDPGCTAAPHASYDDG